jgi:hypothetical protein
VTFVVYIMNVSEHENPELIILSCIWEVVALNCIESVSVHDLGVPFF